MVRTSTFLLPIKSYTTWASLESCILLILSSLTGQHSIPITSWPSLILHRVSFAKNPPKGPISSLLRRRFLFRLALSAAVSIGITGSIQALSGTQQSTIDTGNTLRRVALYIFLVCSALVLLQALFLARVESSGTRSPPLLYVHTLINPRRGRLPRFRPRLWRTIWSLCPYCHLRVTCHKGSLLHRDFL